MSIKEMLFELKYIREGKAIDYWRYGIATRAGYHAKDYPSKPKALFPELYEQQKSVPMPDFLVKDYEKRINQNIRR